MMEIAAFGEVLWDIYPTEKTIGGAPLNFAGHLSLQGNESYLLSSVGRDALAEETLDAVRSLRIRTDHVGRCDTRPTGSCVVTLDGNGVPSYDLKNDVAYDYIDTDGINGADFDAVYYGTLSLRGDHNRKSLEKLLSSAAGALKFCDLNIRAPYYSRDVIRFCIGHADVIKISDEELPTVMETGYETAFEGVEKAAEYLAGHNGNLRLILVTLGAEGSVAYDIPQRRYYRCEAVRTAVVSTVGAGDSFSASFLSEYGKGRSIPECLRFASAVSAFVVSETGAVPMYSAERFLS